MKIIAITLAAACSGAFGAAAAAQDYTASPTYGSVSLSGGFTPDPHRVELTAGGTIDAQSSLGGNCRGRVANAPDYQLHFSPGSLPLAISVDSDADTTLVVNTPGGGWVCDDDGGDEPLNPLLTWNSPPSGRYDIWVGTYSDSTAPATLFISELGEQTRSSSVDASWSDGGLSIGSAAIYGTHSISGGFMPDPWVLNVQSGGPLSASDAVSSDCRGYVTEAPTAELNYSGSGTLHLYTAGSSDTTLVVNAPDGSWRCDDDGGDGVNAGLTFSGGGVYDVYVGSYSSGGGASTRLMASELSMNRMPSPK